MIYIVLRATLHESGNYIFNSDTLLGVYNEYDNALARAKEYVKEKNISGYDLLSDRLYTVGYGREKLSCGCCQEIYAHGFDSDHSGEKVSIFEANIH